MSPHTVLTAITDLNAPTIPEIAEVLKIPVVNVAYFVGALVSEGKLNYSKTPVLLERRYMPCRAGIVNAAERHR